MKTILLLSLICIVYSDIPVHCVHHQIEGKWKLSLSSVVTNGHGPVPCGHQIPDDSETSYSAGQKSFKEEQSFEVELNSDNTVQGGGRWTMVYDEGFEISKDSMKYFAFSKYAPEKGSFTSYCGETLIGWYHDTRNGNRGCYKGTKVESNVEQTSQTYQLTSVVQPEYQNSFLEKVADHNSFVEQLNRIEGKKWEAALYPEFEGKSFKELNSFAGRQRKIRKERNAHAKTENKLGQSFAQTDYPTNFSWEQYLGKNIQQKSCGSCYAIATMEMLSSRLRIKGQDVTLSPQYSLDCNYYNQGCDGGYPFLVEKFAQEQYLVTEEQYPYKAHTGSCQNVDKSGKVFSVQNYKYIGGAYGQSNEQAIMEEIYRNGPVVLNFEPTKDFMYYKKGVYHSVNGMRGEWEKVDHSVLCYGWGEDNGEKYWLLQNSWGENWGENGNFRMRRGVDESAVESMAEAADPIVVGNAGQSYLQMNKMIHD